MLSPTRSLSLACGLLFGGVALLGAQPPPENPRPELEALQRALDRSVSRVSRAAMGPALGADATRGYHVRGYGAVFVLSPRALPMKSDGLLLGFGGDPLEMGLRAMEEGLQRIDSKEMRAQMAAALEELRRSQRRRERAVQSAREALRQAQEHERQVRREVREQRRQLDQQAQQRVAELEELRQRAEAYQREAARAREAAEAALARALEEARTEIHLRVESSPVPRPMAPPPPAAAPAARPSLPPAPSAPTTVAVAPEAPLPPGRPT